MHYACLPSVRYVQLNLPQNVYPIYYYTNIGCIMIPEAELFEYTQHVLYALFAFLKKWG